MILGILTHTNCIIVISTYINITFPIVKSFHLTLALNSSLSCSISKGREINQQEVASKKLEKLQKGHKNSMDTIGKMSVLQDLLAR